MNREVAAKLVESTVMMYSLGRPLVIYVGWLFVGHWLGLLVGLFPAYLLHQRVKAYVGFNLFRYRQIERFEDFIALPTSLKPKLSVPLGEREFNDIPKMFTPQTQAVLKDVHEENGELTYYDFENAKLLDGQLNNRLHQADKDREAADRYKNGAGS